MSIKRCLKILSYKQEIINFALSRGYTLENSRQMSRVPSLLETHNPELYAQLKCHCDWFGDEQTDSERLYCILHDLVEPVICSANGCSNRVKFKGYQQGYHKFCCHECSVNVTKGRQLSPESLKKQKNTLLERYGVTHNFCKGSTLYEQKQQTLIEKYGVVNPSSNADIQQKKQHNIRQKYNGNHFTATSEFRQLLKDRHDVDNVSQLHISPDSRTKLKDREWLYEAHVTQQRTLQSIANELGVSIFCVSLNCKRQKIPIQRYYESDAQREVTKYVEQFGVEVITNHKIGSCEVDIFVPAHNVAIEFDGLYWHSDHHNRITKNYHNNKTLICEQNGVTLLHIFENEWSVERTREIWKNIIAQKLKQSKRVIYARKTYMKILDVQDSHQFLENHHLQGSDNAPVRLGLFDDRNEVVQIMTFRKSRFNKHYEWEISRLAIRSDVVVVGGASKLLKAFINLHCPRSIITYADRRFSTGHVYKTIGFTHLHRSAPNYFYWLPTRSDVLCSRQQFQKHKLPSLLKKVDMNKSEYDNMRANGWYRIWDCGNEVYGITLTASK